MIESQRHRDAEAFHNDFAGSVREAPLLVGVAAEDIPRGRDVLWRYIDQPDVLLLNDSLPQHERMTAVSSGTDQGQYLIQE
jgi:hypothetical protein